MTLVSSKKCLNRTWGGSIFSNEAGMATGTVMLLAVVMASTALGILALNSLNSGRDTRYALFHSMLDIVNNNIYVFGQNDRAWRSTLDHNYSLTYTPKKMACIKEGYNCVILSAGVQWVEDIVLRYPTNATTGSTFYDGSHIDGSARDGFRLDGSICDFSPLNPPVMQDSGCILQVQLQWRPFCISDCRIGPNKVMFEITYKTPKVDENGYSFGNRNFFLPVVPESQSGPMPIYNPFR